MTPTVIIKSGASVIVEGWEGDQVALETGAPGGLKLERSNDVIEVQIGSDGRVHVPLGSSVKVYAGANAEVSKIKGSVTVIAGGRVRVRDVHTLVHGSSGSEMDLECETIVKDETKFEAGRDLRFCIRDLTSARVFVNDQSGYREKVIGDEELTVRLKAGGDVTLVTDQIQAFNR
jgi:hypothetical protein